MGRLYYYLRLISGKNWLQGLCLFITLQAVNLYSIEKLLATRKLWSGLSLTNHFIVVVILILINFFLLYMRRNIIEKKYKSKPGKFIRSGVVIVTSYIIFTLVFFIAVTILEIRNEPKQLELRSDEQEKGKKR